MTSPDANDILMSGGVKPAEFEGVGTTIAGPIMFRPKSYHVREYDRTNPGGGALAYYPSGDPIMGINVDVKTNTRDPANPGDDGTRRLYLDKARQLAAVRQAVRAAGATGLEQGGWLSVTLTGSEEGKGSMPAHTWAAVYRSPSTPIPEGPGQANGYAPQQPVLPVRPVQYAPAPAAPAQYAPATHAPQGQAGDPWAGTPLGAPAAVAAPPPAAQVITETVAAAMRNAGIDTRLFTVVPG